METLTGSGLIRDDEIFLRMNLTERIQHILLIVSFSLLVLTGLPLMFYELRVFKSIFSLGKAFYVRGLLHRAAAVILIVDIVWHFAYTILTRRGRDNFKEMIPGIKDLLDAVTLFGYNVGLPRWLHHKGIWRSFFDRHPFWRFAAPPEYEFFWEQHLDPRDLSAPSYPPHVLVSVPGFWNEQRFEGTKLPGQGYATFRLRVLLSSVRQSLALRILDMGTAFSVYINGEVLGSVGVPGKSRESTVPRYYPQVMAINKSTDPLVSCSMYRTFITAVEDSEKRSNWGGKDNCES